MTNAQAKSAAARNTVINLRASDRQKALIDQAAEALGKNRSDFMLDASCREAQAVLLDRLYFPLDTATFDEFTAILDAPPTDNPRLRRLLAEKAPWER